MQVEIQIDSSCKEPRIRILTDKMTQENQTLIRKLSEEAPRMLAGFRGRSPKRL